MRSFSAVELLGHLTADPVWKALESGNSVVNFSIAINSKYKAKDGIEKETVNFFDVVLWGNSALSALKLLKKWDYVMVKWSLKNSSWQDQNWVKRNKTEIVWEDYYLLSSKKSDSDAPEPSDFLEWPELDLSDLWEVV